MFTVPPPPDTTAPSIAITMPITTGTYVTSSSTMLMRGTASDNVAVTQVSWSTDRGGSGVATGTSTWAIDELLLANGVTVVTVVARDAANNTASVTLTVTYHAPPGPATLVAPSGVIADATPSFTWAAVSGATEYLLWVNAAGHPARINTTYTATAAGCAAGTGTCTVSPGVTLPPGPAMWWIRTANAAGPGPWSIALAFTVPTAPDTTAPSIAIAMPSSTGTHTATSSTLAMSGTASDEVAVTQVTWSTDRGDSGVATGTTAWTIGAVPLGAGITVVTVAARDAAGNTSRATLAVTYITPPGPATLVAPSGVIAEATPSFTWAAVSGATEYLLWVNLAGRPGVINTTYTATAAGCAAGTGTCTVSPGVMLPPGPALWWIHTANAIGQGSWSSALAFTVP